MIDGVLLVMVIVAAVGSGVNGGIFFAFSTFAMSGLRRLPPLQGLAAMQEINITAVTPPFMSVLFGTAAACVAVAIGAVVDWSGSASVVLLIGSGVYLLGIVVMTAAFHVPRNDALAVVDPAASDAAERWADYAASWTAGNHVRTAAGAASAALFVVATRI